MRISIHLMSVVRTNGLKMNVSEGAMILADSLRIGMNFIQTNALDGFKFLRVKITLSISEMHA